MSVFRVKLQNNSQGLLDVDSSGVQNSTSIQRTMYVMGPKRINRKLTDGQTFTDSNYWKKFAYPQMSLDQAFIEVVTDDGSVYSENESENTYPVVWLPGASDDGILVAGDTYDDDGMSLDIMTTYGGPAVFVQLQNIDSSHAARVKLNGSSTAVFTLDANTTQVFNSGDIAISSIAFDNSLTGASNVNKVEVILSVKSVSNS